MNIETLFLVWCLYFIWMSVISFCFYFLYYVSLVIHWHLSLPVFSWLYFHPYRWVVDYSRKFAAAFRRWYCSLSSTFFSVCSPELMVLAAWNKETMSIFFFFSSLFPFLHFYSSLQPPSPIIEGYAFNSKVLSISNALIFVFGIHKNCVNT